MMSDYPSQQAAYLQVQAQFECQLCAYLIAILFALLFKLRRGSGDKCD
jgi:hypothetical protein